MKITIITVCYNSAATIRDTLESVKRQKNADYEHLIIDGGSKDDTLKIVDEFQRPELTVHSGPDKGIYDAMNKGIRLAKGTVIGFLNSDDFFASDDILQHLSQTFETIVCDAIYGDIFYVKQDRTSDVLRTWKSREFASHRMRWGWHPPHPSFYVKAEIIAKLGGFNLSYPIAADYDFMIRCLNQKDIKVAYLPEIFVRMRTGGTSNQSLKNILRANRECYNSAKNAGFRFPGLIVLAKVLRKVFQFPIFQSS